MKLQQDYRILKNCESKQQNERTNSAIYDPSKDVHYFSLDDVVQLQSPIERDVLVTEKITINHQQLGSPNWC